MWISFVHTIDIAQTESNFGNNSVETSHKITCDDLIEQHMDHIYPVCVHCVDQNYDLDVPAAYRPVCAKFHRTKKNFLEITQNCHKNQVKIMLSRR